MSVQMRDTETENTADWHPQAEMVLSALEAANPDDRRNSSNCNGLRNISSVGRDPPTLANTNVRQALGRERDRVKGRSQFGPVCFFTPQKTKKNISLAHKNRAIDQP